MVHPGRIGVGLQFGQEFCNGGAYTGVDRRILVSSRRKREFLDSTPLKISLKMTRLITFEDTFELGG